jgi:hypothetical protein
MGNINHTESPSYIKVNTPFNITFQDDASWFYQRYKYRLYISGFIFSNFTWLSQSELRFNGVRSNIAGNVPYTLISDNGDEYNGYISVQEICFGEGTKILCSINNNEEYVNIQDIQIGTLVKTYKNGYVPVLRIVSHGQAQNIFKNNQRPSNILYKMNKNSLGNNEPFEDLYVTGLHSILLDKLTIQQKNKQRKYSYKIKTIEDKTLLNAATEPLLFEPAVEHPYNVYHIALESDDIDKQYGIYANGILTESISIRDLKFSLNENSKAPIDITVSLSK